MDETTETGCCPRFNPAPWDSKEVTWQDKPFVRDRVRSLFHVPLNFGHVMQKNMQAIEAADALDPDHVMLSDENSLWGADVYIAVSKEVPVHEWNVSPAPFSPRSSKVPTAGWEGGQRT